MYNLLVSGNDETWEGAPFDIELSRCVREYTDAEITRRYGELDINATSKLKRLPTIFAYEAACKKAPKFGIITEIIRRFNQVRIEYEIKNIEPFLAAADLESMKFELEIGTWEMNRTHWAVKDINLPKELSAKGIILPTWVRDISNAIDITSHVFDVGLSFPGEAREAVEAIAARLERDLGPNTYFYDNNYVGQLARPSLDTLLQDIYGKRSRLVVVFLSADYQRKNWCGVEFRAIKEIFMARDHDKIMFVRTDDGDVEGIFKTDGYVDARKYGPDEVAHFICERVALLARKNFDKN